MANRIERAFTDNIYLMESVPPTKKDEENFERKFVVMGSTGNLYKITIGNEPKCSCPDHRMNHRRCKHLYFILIRVMKALNERQSFYDDGELKEMFDSIPAVARALKPSSDIRNNYKKIKSTTIKPIIVQKDPDEDESDEEEEEEKKENEELKIVDQKPIEGDTCPICLDDLTEGKELVYCKYSCGKSLHKQCFSMWSRQNNNTCVFCRGEWIKAIPEPKPKKKIRRNRRNPKPKKPEDWLKRRGYFNLYTDVSKSVPEKESESESESEEVKIVPKKKAPARSKSKKDTKKEKAKKLEKARKKEKEKEKKKEKAPRSRSRKIK